MIKLPPEHIELMGDAIKDHGLPHADDDLLEFERRLLTQNKTKPK